MNLVNFLALLLLNGLSCSVYSIVAPYFPDEAHKVGLSSATIGLIISAFPVSAVIAGLSVTYFMSSVSKKTTFIIGALLQAFSTFFYAFIPYFSYTSFIILSCSLRIIQGLGTGLLNTSLFAIISSEFPTEIPKYLGFIHISVGLGTISGAAGASALYSFGGYSMVFITYGIIFFISIPALFWLIKVDKSVVIPKKGITLLTILSHPEEFLYTLVLLASTTSICFIFPTLSLHLGDFGVSEEYFGVIFGILFLGYMISIPLVLNLRVPLKLKPLIGLFFLVVCNLMLGPWEYTRLPHVLAVSVIGLGIMGFGACCCNLNVMPIILALAQKRYPDRDKQRINDVVSGLTGSAYFFVESYAPPLSGLMNDLVGFDNTQALLAAAISVLIIPVVVANVRKSGSTDEGLELKVKLKDSE